MIKYIQEDHSKEQYFYAPETIKFIAGFLVEAGYKKICCLCTPSLGEYLEKNHPELEVTTLDIDTRFSHLKGFISYDLYRPEWMGEEYDIILCDPPFYKVSLSQLFTAIRTLARNDYRQKIMLTYLSRREKNITGTFARFGVESLGINAKYLTIKNVEKNVIQWYGNIYGI